MISLGYHGCRSTNFGGAHVLDSTIMAFPILAQTQNIKRETNPMIHTHRIHVWYICLHLVVFYGFHVGKYTSPMDHMGYEPRHTWNQLLRCGGTACSFLEVVSRVWQGCSCTGVVEKLPAIKNRRFEGSGTTCNWVLLFCCFFLKECPRRDTKTRWCFQIYFKKIHCYLGKIPILTIFLKGVVQPPTRKKYSSTCVYLLFHRLFWLIFDVIWLMETGSIRNSCGGPAGTTSLGISLISLIPLAPLSLVGFYM